MLSLLIQIAISRNEITYAELAVRPALSLHPFEPHLAGAVHPQFFRLSHGSWSAG